jgi:hypothetical protein
MSTITPATVAAGNWPSQHRTGGPSAEPQLSPMMVGMLLMPFSGRIRRRAGKHMRAATLLLFAAVVVPLTGLAGCASRSSSSLDTRS